MALRIPVQKDIGEYEEKIVGKMSLRTLACVSLGFGSAVGAAAFVHLGLRADVADAAFPIMLCSMPFWLAGFWRALGLPAQCARRGAAASPGGTRAFPAAARVRALPRREPSRGLAAPGPPGAAREAQGQEERSRAL